MTRLIDANALLEKFQFRMEIDNKNAEIISGCVDIARRIINNEPTVDAVEVVRCVNCQSHEPCEVRNRVWCKTMGRYMKEDGFCSEGENNAENH